MSERRFPVRFTFTGWGGPASSTSRPIRRPTASRKMATPCTAESRHRIRDRCGGRPDSGSTAAQCSHYLTGRSKFSRLSKSMTSASYLGSNLDSPGSRRKRPDDDRRMLSGSVSRLVELYEARRDSGCFDDDSILPDTSFRISVDSFAREDSRDDSDTELLFYSMTSSGMVSPNSSSNFGTGNESACIVRSIHHSLSVDVSDYVGGDVNKRGSSGSEVSNQSRHCRSKSERRRKPVLRG